MKRYIWIWTLLTLLLAGCEDDLGQEGAISGEGVTEGMITIRVATEQPPVVITRAGDIDEKESIENVLVMVFDKDGKLVNKAYQQLTVDNKSVNIYLTAEPDQLLYALCNLPESTEDKGLTEDLVEAEVGTFSLNELKTKYAAISSPEGAYAGKHLMSGSISLALTKSNQLQKEYTILVKRLTAQLNFFVEFAPLVNTDEFAVGEMFICNIPLGSMLLDGGSEGGEAAWGVHHADDPLLDSLDICNKDYSYVVATDKTDRSAQFYMKQKRLDFEVVKGAAENRDSYKSSFNMFENRQGRVYDHIDNWKHLQGLVGVQPESGPIPGYEDLYRYYQQTNKRGLAGTDRNPEDAKKIFKRNVGENVNKYTCNIEEQGFKYATYLIVKGIYTKKNQIGTTNPTDATYYIYLGSDNYRDFNICRNTIYCYHIRILDVDKTDTRVDANSIGGLTVYGNFDDILDAHPNVTQVLIYSPSRWSVHVADPDETPWLEVSSSADYKPRKLGEQASRDQASFRLQGEAGLHYLFVHTDEYIPPLKTPNDNDRFRNHPRVGKLVFTNEAGKGKEVEIKQYAAQMVVRERFAVDKAKKVTDTFYVERVLEKKHMQWGFHEYWSNKINNLVDNDLDSRYNGLTNTVTLHEVALKGDSWGIEPAYKDGVIPANIALGYALNKNRDRNGNGKIDKNEILWYLPAYTELEAIVGHIKGGSRNYPKEHDLTVDVDWSMEPCTFFSSSPSANDPGGLTAGFCWAVQFSPNQKKNGKAKVEMRTRFFNVICARRYNGSRGPQSAEGEGSVGKDEVWNEDEEIMDKNITENK